MFASVQLWRDTCDRVAKERKGHEGETGCVDHYRRDVAMLIQMARSLEPQQASSLAAAVADLRMDFRACEQLAYSSLPFFSPLIPVRLVESRRAICKETVTRKMKRAFGSISAQYILDD